MLSSFSASIYLLDVTYRLLQHEMLKLMMVLMYTLADLNVEFLSFIISFSYLIPPKFLGVTCHAQCEMSRGCWGTLADECVQCRSYQYQGICVDTCNE